MASARLPSRMTVRDETPCCLAIVSAVLTGACATSAQALPFIAPASAMLFFVLLYLRPRMMLRWSGVRLRTYNSFFP